MGKLLLPIVMLHIKKAELHKILAKLIIFNSRALFRFLLITFLVKASDSIISQLNTTPILSINKEKLTLTISQSR